MYKILILISFICINCKAQVVSITTENSWYSVPVNGYYKDAFNLLNPYIGTWKYQNTNTNTTLIIKLRKVINTDIGNINADLLVGEYQYIKNGVELINTLNNFNTDFSNQLNHEIYSRAAIKTSKAILPNCTECDEEIPCIQFIYSDPHKEVTGSILIGIYNSSNTIKAYFESDGIKYTETDPNDIDSIVMQQVGHTIPNTSFTLIKQ